MESEAGGGSTDEAQFRAIIDLRCIAKVDEFDGNDSEGDLVLREGLNHHMRHSCVHETHGRHCGAVPSGERQSPVVLCWSKVLTSPGKKKASQNHISLENTEEMSLRF